MTGEAPHLGTRGPVAPKPPPAPRGRGARRRKPRRLGREGGEVRGAFRAGLLKNLVMMIVILATMFILTAEIEARMSIVAMIMTTRVVQVIKDQRNNRLLTLVVASCERWWLEVCQFLSAGSVGSC